MPYTELATNYNTTGDVITIIIALAFIFMIRESLFISADFNFVLFRGAVILVGVSAGLNILFGYLSTLPVEHYIVIHICRALYNSLLILTMYAFCLYIRNLAGVKGLVRKIMDVAFGIWTIIAMVLCFISPITHFGFYREENGLWARHGYTNPFAISYMLFMSMILIVLIVYRRNIVKQINNILLFSFILCVVVVAMDNTKLGNSYLAFSFMAPMIVCLVMIHSKPYDVNLGAMGVEAFESYVSHELKKKKALDYYVISLDVTNANEIPIKVQKGMYRFCHEYLDKGNIFDVLPGLYIIVEEQGKKTERDNNYVKLWFDDELPNLAEKYQFDYKVQIYKGIDFVDDVYEFARYLENFNKKINNKDIFVAGDKDIEEIKSARIIIENLWDIDEKMDLNDDRVLVYCQPVKNLETGRFDTAEALMRMQLPELGFVFPDKFIPIAEDIGVIHTLSMIILNKACVAVRKLIDEGYEFSRVSVNFSTSEFKSISFGKDVADIIGKNNIPFEKIAIELTESTDSDDFSGLIRAINELKGLGMRFYLDDFGTGYSNYDRILKLNLDIVKFDRSLLLLANKDDRVKQMIGHFAAAFKGLGYKVLFEGVETEDDEELCRECGTQYLQGYKYSKPIPIDNLREFFVRS